ncbi:MAG: response regulator [Lachnospiraceae bacterium]|nr:response regulator [Lachnospiraceae bacterium]
MNSKDKPELFSIFTKAMWIFFQTVMVCLFLFFVIGQSVMPDERDKMDTECRIFEAQWQRVMKSGEKVSVTVPGKVEAENGEVVVFTTVLPDKIYNGEMLCFRAIWQDVEIYVGGELRQRYCTENSRLFGKNSALRNIFVSLEEGDAGKELMYKISSNSKYAGTIQETYIGDRTSIWLHMIEETGSKTIVSIFLFLMSLFCIIVCLILRFVYKKRLALENLAWSIFLCALWMLSETEFRQLLFHSVSILSSYTYWSLMLIPIPMNLYMNEMQEGRYKKCYAVCLVYSMVTFVVGTVLQVFDIVQFVQQLPYIQFGVALSIVLIIGTITRDVIKKQISDYFVIGVGVYGMLLTAVLELGLYYIDSGLSLGTFLGLGLLFLLIMAIIKTGQDLVKFEKNRQQAVAAKDAQAKFLANMSHEIRTPINVVLGMNEMILRESDNKAISEYARNIQSASDMLLGLINDVLDFSKIESGQLDLVEDTYSFSSLIQDEILLFNARAASKTISTEVKIDPKIPSKLYGDELRIKQILTNLLSNAVKYTKEGQVTLKVFFSWIDKDTVSLSFAVIDTGIGIKKEDLPSLFDSFKRFELNVNRNIEGTGLGLNIVKQLVGLMQGDISVESEYGKGSTFTVSIPQKVMDKQPVGNLKKALEEKRAEDNAPTKVFTAPDAKMLVVDDNALNLAVMKELLKRTKIQTDYVKSGEECLEMTSRKVYDIILMDHMMPVLDGVETLHRLRKDTLNPNQNTTVIALTANAVAGCKEMYLNYGFNDYFSKPIQADKLEALLMQYLGKKKSADVLHINREKGLSHCMESESFYHDILLEFCEQCTEFLPQLENCFKNSDWEKYTLIAHMLKEDALNIGADNFSELAQRHERAGENKDIDFIEAEYSNWTESIEILVQKIRDIS